MAPTYNKTNQSVGPNIAIPKLNDIGCDSDTSKFGASGVSEKRIENSRDQRHKCDEWA